MSKDNDKIESKLADVIDDFYVKPTVLDAVNPGDNAEEVMANKVSDSAALEIARRTYSRAMETEITKQFLPDINIISQLISTNVLSPQDSINVVVKSGSSSTKISPTIKSALAGVVDDKILTEFKLDRLAEKVLDDCLFGTGSVPVMIIPHDSIKKVIATASNKSSNESAGATAPPIIEEKGIFGKKKDLANANSSESERIGRPHNRNKEEVVMENIDLVDDIGYVPYQEYLDHEKIRDSQDVYQTTLSKMSLESSGDPTRAALKEKYQSILKSMAEKSSGSYYPTSSLRIPFDRKVTSDPTPPLMLPLSSESVIPIIMSGDNSKRVGYIVLYSGSGVINVSKDIEGYMRGLAGGFSDQSGGGMSEGISRMGSALISSYSSNTTSAAQIRSTYGSFMEAEINRRIKAGVLGDRAEVVMDDSVKLAMFHRALVGKRTTMLYVPDQLMTYFAFDYDDNGVGKSLIASSSVIAGMRAALTYSDGLRAIKNTIGSTHLHFDLDPADTNPRETVEDGLHNYMALNTTTLPIGGNMMDSISNAKAASIVVSASGNTKYPETKMNVENTSPQNQLTDEDTHLRFQKHHLLHFGVTPEQIDTSIDIERAGQITTNNLMFYKRTRKIARDLCPQMSDHIRKLSLYNGEAINKMMDVLKETISAKELSKIIEELDSDILDDKDDSKLYMVVNEFINTLEFILPEPSGSSDKTLSEGFDELSNYLDQVLDATLTSDIINEESSGDLSGSVDEYKAKVKAYYLRRYCIDNHFMEDVVLALTPNDKNELDKDISGFIAKYDGGVNTFLLKMKEGIGEVRESADNELSKLHMEDPVEEGVEKDTPADDTGDNDISDNLDDIE